MYSTKMKLDLTDGYTASCLRDCQKLHSAVLQAFRSRRSDAELLFAVHDDVLYTRSLTKPLWRNTRLHFIKAKQEEKNVGWYEEGEYQFVIWLNPTKKCGLKEFPDRKRRRLFIGDPAKRKKWFEDIGEQRGFRVLEISETDSNNFYGVRKRSKGSKVVYNIVKFEGVLQVYDSEKFQTAVCEGIGPGKAFGLGMLVLRKAVK